MSLRWFLLRVSPLCERAVETRLRRRFPEEIATFLPLARDYCRKRGGWHHVERVVFPRYLFVGAFEGLPWLFVHEVAGVHGVYAIDGVPLAVRPLDVYRIMARCARGMYDSDGPPMVQTGMGVIVSTGALHGEEGVVKAIDKRTRTADVWMELYDGAPPARIHLDDLVPVSYASMRKVG